jgi:4-hydroxy-3-methylbut-2-enyl diphosphate reductase
MRLEEGVEGLIHVSQLARGYVENPSQAVSVGDQVKAKVTRIDFHNRRMALSIKKYLLEKEEEEELAQYKASEEEVKPRTDDNEQKIEERG